MSHIYIAIDCSSTIVLHHANNTVTFDKYRRALKFSAAFVEELMTIGGFDVHLISLTQVPKLVRSAVTSVDDVTESFPTDVISPGKLDFLALRDLILEQKSLTDFELILLLDAFHYRWIPTSFQLPCPVHFLILSDDPVSACPKLLTEFHAISLCCDSSGAAPSFIWTDENAVAVAKQIACIPRLQKTATLAITASQKIQIHLLPGMQKSTLNSYDGQMTKIVAGRRENDLNSSFRLLGFMKGELLLNVPSSSFCHILRCTDTHPSDGWKLYHLLAEVLGSEGQVAVVQEEKAKEQYVLKPYRDDPSKLWILCLQLIPSATIKWKTLSSQHVKVEFPEVSYKQNASTRIYWTDQHGIQSDIQRLQRLIKRTDRLDQFKQEIKRIATYATAFGYCDFARTFADVIERKFANIPNENKAVLQQVTCILREGGGFKQLMQMK